MTIPLNPYGNFGVSPFFGMPPPPPGAKGNGADPYAARPNPPTSNPVSPTLATSPASQLMGNVSQMVQFLIAAPNQLIQQASAATSVSPTVDGREERTPQRNRNSTGQSSTRK